MGRGRCTPRLPSTWPEVRRTPRSVEGAPSEKRLGAGPDRCGYGSVRFPSHCGPQEPVTILLFFPKIKWKETGFLTERGLRQPRPRWREAGGRGPSCGPSRSRGVLAARQ